MLSLTALSDHCRCVLLPLLLLHATLPFMCCRLPRCASTSLTPVLFAYQRVVIASHRTETTKRDVQNDKNTSPSLTLSHSRDQTVHHLLLHLVHVIFFLFHSSPFFLTPRLLRYPRLRPVHSTTQTEILLLHTRSPLPSRSYCPLQRHSERVVRPSLPSTECCMAYAE